MTIDQALWWLGCLAGRQWLYTSGNKVYRLSQPAYWLHGGRVHPEAIIAEAERMRDKL